MLIIKKKFETKENEYEINGEVACLKLRKKNGKFIDAKIDAEDLKRVLEKGTWIAQWHKDFNNYLVQNVIFSNVNGKKRKETQSLHTFIMNAHPKAPVRHLNGDTLDNRKCNLEIFDQNKENEYEEKDSETTAIILRDKYGIVKAKAIIDKEDLDKVVNSGYVWVYYKRQGEPCAVANSPEGRIFLDRFIMNTPEEEVAIHINLNPLDNRKCNLENKILSDDSESENEEKEE